MNRLTLFLIGFFVALSAFAGKVTEQEAMQKAQQFLQGKQIIHKDKAKKLVKRAQSHLNQAFYIFNVENNEGFVIVSGDDRTDAILGYSEHGNLDMETAPSNVKWLLQAYEKTIRNLNDNDKDSNESEPNPRTNVAPLLETTWGQMNPYNQLCPIVDDQHCLTGCAATALAQVVFYCGWPQDYTASIPAYTTSTLGIEQPELPPTKFNWDYLSGNAVARLMQYCGQAVKMDYGLNESGAMPTDYATALNNYFGYTDATLVARADYSDEEWDELVYNEVKEKRAVVYSGYSTNCGHTFVIDGYQDNKFHINWGWVGDYDGYFSLNYLSPNGSNYRQAQSAVINIQPHYIRKSEITVVQIQNDGQSIIERINVTGDFPESRLSYRFKSNLTNETTIQVGWGLFNDEGLIMELSDEPLMLTPGGEDGHCGCKPFGSKLPDGIYEIAPICRLTKNEEWHVVAGYTNYCFIATINQLTMKLDTSLPKFNEGKNYQDYGNVMINGINYHLQSFYGRNSAEVQNLPGNQKYSGDIFIPDYVEYQNMRFEVVGCQYHVFEFCNELTGLSFSIPSYMQIDRCPKLSKLEIREGVIRDVGINYCNSLDSVVYPSTYTYADFIASELCENVKKITFLCTQSLQITYNVLTRFSDDFYNHSLTDIYFYSEYPPTVLFYDDIPVVNVNVHIRKGLLEAYKNSYWSGCNLIEDLPPVENIKWGYCGNTIVDFGYGKVNKSLRSSCKAGINNNAEMAIRIPASDLKHYLGNKITGIQFYTTEKPSAIMDNEDPDAYDYENIEYIFVTKDGTDYLVKADVSTIRGCWMNVIFDQPYTIKEEDLYVGVGRYSVVQMPCAADGVMEQGIWQRYMGYDTSNGIVPGAWERRDDYLRPLSIRILIQGDNLPSDLLICGVDTVNDNNADGSKICRKKLWVRSRTPKLVKSFSVGIYEKGELLDIQSFEALLLPNQDDYFVVDIPMAKDGYGHSVTLKILSINGEEDAIPENSTTIICYTSPIKGNYPRKIVFEEATSAHCGWSPRGIEIVKMMKESYPESFIPIAIHLDYGGMTDIMNSFGNGYQQFEKEVISLPSCHLNRMVWDDVLSLKTIWNTIETQKDSAIATISGKAVFVDEDSTKVLITTESKFGFDARGTDGFRIAYVVMEDSVGPYEQMNSYSGYSLSEAESYMEWWTHQEYWPTIYHHNVARGIYEDYYGMTRSIPEIIVAEETYNGYYTLTLPANIQQKKNIHIAVLLIDVATGEVLNADDVKIAGNISQYPHIIVRNVSKVYGDALPQFEYDIIGEVDGVPEFSCEAMESSPVGTYPIVLSKGTISNPNTVLVNGTLTISKAPLTITAGTYTKKQYEPMPEFTVSYNGFKNNETELVVTKRPVISCEAKEESSPGEYDIVVGGAEALNYEIQYVSGKLTVTEPDSYSLTYLVDGEEYKSLTVKYRETITPLNAPEKEGYTFSGWSDIPATMPANDVVVTGTFTVNTYAITFMYNDKVLKVDSVEYGAVIPLPKSLNSERYSLIEWLDVPKTMPAHDIIIYASVVDGILTFTDEIDYKIYNERGLRISRLQRGLNIIKYSNGRIRKVIIK